MQSNFDDKLRQAAEALRRKQTLLEHPQPVLDGVFAALEEKRRRRGLWWWLGGLLLVAGISYAAVYYFTPAPGGFTLAEARLLRCDGPTVTAHHWRTAPGHSSQNGNFTVSPTPILQKNSPTPYHPKRHLRMRTAENVGPTDQSEHQPVDSSASLVLPEAETVQNLPRDSVAEPEELRHILPLAPYNTHGPRPLHRLRSTQPVKHLRLQPGKTRFYVGAYSSLQLSSLNILHRENPNAPNYTINEEYSRKLSNSNSFRPGVDAGVTFGIQRGHFVFETGLAYTHLIFVKDFNQLAPFYPNLPPPSNATSEEYNYLEVPLYFGLQFPIRRFSIAISMGFSSGWLSINKEYDYAPGNYQLIYNPQQIQRPLILTPVVKADFIYHITDRYAVSFSPTFRHDLSGPVVYSIQNVTYPLAYSLGFRVGFRYQFSSAPKITTAP